MMNYPISIIGNYMHSGRRRAEMEYKDYAECDHREIVQSHPNFLWCPTCGWYFKKHVHIDDPNFLGGRRREVWRQREEFE
jgi:hypothetical protein